MAVRRGKHRRPSARPALTVTVSAAAMLVAAAVPASSVVDSPVGSPVRPSPVSQLLPGPASGDGSAASLEYLIELAEQLAQEDSEGLAATLKEHLAVLEEYRTDLRRTAEEISADAARQLELTEVVLEELMSLTLRQVHGDVVAALASFKEQLEDLSDQAEARDGEADAGDLYTRIVETLRGVVGPG